MTCALAYHIPICTDRSRPLHKTKARTRGGYMESTSEAAAPHGAYFRWMQLAMGIVCMAMVANLQYGWTLFVDPIDQKYHWGRAAIQLAFTPSVVTETWLVPVEAWFVNKYGPSIVVRFGGVMIAIAWVLNSFADPLVLLNIGASCGGI